MQMIGLQRTLRSCHIQGWIMREWNDGLCRWLQSYESCGEISSAETARYVQTILRRTVKWGRANANGCNMMSMRQAMMMSEVLKTTASIRGGYFRMERCINEEHVICVRSLVVWSRAGYLHSATVRWMLELVLYEMKRQMAMVDRISASATMWWSM